MDICERCKRSAEETEASVLGLYAQESGTDHNGTECPSCKPGAGTARPGAV